MNHKYGKLFVGAATIALAATSLGTAAVAQDDGYNIAMSNTTVGNGWREEMRCSILAEAKVSGEVASVNEFHENSDATGQLESIRNFINADVDAIIINPVDAEALNSAIKEATDAGIVVVAVDQAVTEPSAYVMSNNQEDYAYQGATWLFEQLGGEGDVFYMRGIAGAGADDDRDVGFHRALDEHPDINIVGEVHTGWDFPTGKQQMLDFIASGIPVDGVWTSGIDLTVVDAFVESEVPLVPIVGSDNAGFVKQLNEIEGFVGAGVTNPGSIGGAGVALALQILNGELPKVPADAESQVIFINPSLLENATEEGAAAIAGLLDPTPPALDPTWPVGITVDGWTHYDKADIIGCEGPGA